MKVRDVMRRKPITIKGDEPISLALQAMLWTGFRHLPVMQNDRVIGVLSERDVLRYRADHPEGNALSAPVSKAMSAPPNTVAPDAPLVEAAERMMAHKNGCLPVTQCGKLVGLVTTTDVLRAEVRLALRGEERRAPTAAEMMTRDVMSCTPESSVVDAIDTMIDGNVRHLPVVDETGRLCGMVSERDVRPERDPEGDLRSHGFLLRGLRVGTLMDEDPVALPENAPLAELLTAFTDYRLTAVPIVDEHSRLKGIVSYVDVLRALARA